MFDGNGPLTSTPTAARTRPSAPVPLSPPTLFLNNNPFEAYIPPSPSSEDLVDERYCDEVSPSRVSRAWQKMSSAIDKIQNEFMRITDMADQQESFHSHQNKVLAKLRSVETGLDMELAKMEAELLITNAEIAKLEQSFKDGKEVGTAPDLTGRKRQLQRIAQALRPRLNVNH